MYQVMTGALAMGCAVIALYFLKFWTRTRDRFFLYFALSFLIEGASRVYLTLAEPAGAAPYLVRLAAYVFILLAILEKNRRPKIQGKTAQAKAAPPPDR